MKLPNKKYVSALKSNVHVFPNLPHFGYNMPIVSRSWTLSGLPYAQKL